jgi:hypothetical protein
LAAAVGRLAERRRDELLAAADALPAGPERVARGLDLLFDSYASPLFQGAMDLWSTGRTDPELRPHLVEVERALDRQTLELARRLFPAAAERPDFERLVEMSVATVRGLALVDMLHPGGDRGARQWPFCRERLAALLG